MDDRTGPNNSTGPNRYGGPELFGPTRTIDFLCLRVLSISSLNKSSYLKLTPVFFFLASLIACSSTSMPL